MFFFGNLNGRSKSVIVLALLKFSVEAAVGSLLDVTTRIVVNLSGLP